MKAQADGDDGKEFDQGTDSPMTTLELMQHAYKAGKEDGHPPALRGWEDYWLAYGQAALVRYRGWRVGDVKAPMGPGEEGHAAVLQVMHTVLAANNAMLITMINAMQEMEPDDTVDEEGEVWTLTATTPDGISLVRTVRCLTMTTAIATATKAWGHGLWESLRNRRAVSDG